ncbi:conserved hypothetical protein, partial [Trichinella spiralis]|uniref:hypothetical protein n=1 Tax=Trichinella spiralis TaxID=6334 RepID=UPI0001EFD6CD
MDRNCWSYDNEFDWTSKLNQAVCIVVVVVVVVVYLDMLLTLRQRQARRFTCLMRCRIRRKKQKKGACHPILKKPKIACATFDNPPRCLPFCTTIGTIAINSNTVDVVDDPGVRSQQPINPQMDSGDCDT